MGIFFDMETNHQVIGKWKGYYAYKLQYLADIAGAEKTYFTIDITEMQSGKFSGIVLDDVTTGGMEEVGKISGELDGGLVYFKKYMPVRSTFTADGKVEKMNRPHPVIHYKGEYFPLEKKMQGTWKIKGGLFFYKRRLYINRATTGVWEMSMTDQ